MWTTIRDLEEMDRKIIIVGEEAKDLLRVRPDHLIPCMRDECQSAAKVYREKLTKEEENRIRFINPYEMRATRSCPGSFFTF